MRAHKLIAVQQGACGTSERKIAVVEKYEDRL